MANPWNGDSVKLLRFAKNGRGAAGRSGVLAPWLGHREHSSRHRD